MAQVVVTQLIVDASGARTGVADYEASMARAKAAAVDTGNVTATAFERAQQRWQASLAATDPVVRAQIAMQQALAKQSALNADAVNLGIASQEAAAAQLDRVAQKYQAYVTAAEEAKAASVASSEASAAAAVESAGVQIAANEAVEASSVKIREGLVLLREASVGNFTRMAGSASILANAFGLLETILVPLIAIGVTLGTGFALGAEQINKSAGDLTNGLGLTEDQLDRVTQRTVGFKDVALATFQVLGTDIAANFKGAGDEITKDLDGVANGLGDLLAALVGGVVGVYDGIVATWKQLPAVFGDIFVSAANAGIKGLQALVDAAVSGINAIIEFSNKMNSLPGIGNGVSLGTIQAPDLGQIKNEFAGAGSAAASSFGSAFKKGFTTGSQSIFQFFGDVADQALTNRTNEILKEAGNAAKEANDNAVLSAAKMVMEANAQASAQMGLSQAIADGTMTVGQAVAQNKIDSALKSEIAKLDLDANLTATQRKSIIDALTASQQGLNAAEGAFALAQSNADMQNRTAAEKAAYDAVAAGTITYSQATNAVADYLAALKDLDLLSAAEASHDQKKIDQIKQETAARIADTQAARDQQDATTIQKANDQLQEQIILDGMSADARERETAVLQLQHSLNGQLSLDAANHERDLVATDQLAKQLGSTATDVTNSFQDFFVNVLSGGKNAFQSLVDSIKTSFIKLLAYMAVQAIANPIIVPIVESLGGGALGIGSLLGVGGTSGGGSLLGALGNLSSAGGTTGGSGLFGQIGQQLSGAMNWLNSGIDSIGESLGFGSAISGVAVTPSVLTGGLGVSVTPSALTSGAGLFGASTLGSVLGSAGMGLGIGSLVGSLTGGNSLGSSIGGAIAGTIGNILLPGIGGILGSALGGAIGGLFGPGKSAGHAVATFDSNGAITGYEGDKATQKSSQAVQEAAQSIQQVTQALQAAGIDINNSISKLVISDNRDKSFITTDTGQKITVGNVGDPNSAIQGTLAYLLKGATSANPDIAQVLQHYQATGGITSSNASQFQSDIEFAQGLATTTHQVTVQLGDAADALKQVQQAYDADIARAKSLGLSTSELLANEQADIAAMQKSTSDAYVAQFQSITAQLGPQLDTYQQAGKEISDTLAQATSDMDALGGSLTDVTAAAAAASAALQKSASDNYVAQFQSITQQIEPQLDSYQQAAKSISDTLAQATTDLTALGGSLTDVKAAAAAASAALASAFNADISSQLQAIVNPTVQAFDALAASQYQRIDDAKAAGGDLAQVNALNNAEIEKFIGGLTDDQRAALAASGALNTQWVAYTNSVTSLSDGIAALLTRANAASQAAQAAAQAWGSAQQAIDQARNALLISGPGVSPQNAYLAAQQQYSTLLQQAKTDPQAASDFSSFASTFLQTSLAYNATGGQYGSDFSRVQADLASLSGIAGNQVTVQQQAADLAQQTITALTTMQQQLASGEPSISVLQSQLAQQQQIVAALEAGNVLTQQSALTTASALATAVAANDNALVKSVLSVVAPTVTVPTPVAPTAPIIASHSPPKTAAPATPPSQQIASDPNVTKLTTAVGAFAQQVQEMKAELKAGNFRGRQTQVN